MRRRAASAELAERKLLRPDEVGAIEVVRADCPQYCPSLVRGCPTMAFLSALALGWAMARLWLKEVYTRRTNVWYCYSDTIRALTSQRAPRHKSDVNMKNDDAKSRKSMAA